jgi:hypothetical protein
VQQSVEVEAEYLTVDPEKTGSSYTFTQQDLKKLPDPLIDTTNDRVNNFMPGASDTHDNAWPCAVRRVRCTSSSTGCRFLDNTQPQFSPGISPQIFETADLIEEIRSSTRRQGRWGKLEVSFLVSCPESKRWVLRAAGPIGKGTAESRARSASVMNWG